MVEVEPIECAAGRGLPIDRFSDFKKDYKGRITFFAMEVFESLRRELNLTKTQPQATRGSAFVRGAA